MKRKKLLKKLNTLLGMGEKADKEQVKKLHKVLKILKEKQASLQVKLDCAESDEERRKIKQKIEVIQRQRKKGVAVYKAMKEARG
jgi:hypothetical protein